VAELAVTRNADGSITTSVVREGSVGSQVGSADTFAKMFDVHPRTMAAALASRDLGAERIDGPGKTYRLSGDVVARGLLPSGHLRPVPEEDV
jgi:hypothetical protein